jgi:hypothetical protein
MTVVSRKQSKTTRRPAPRVIRKRKPASPEALATVYLVRPKGTPAAIERGRRLAEEVRKELAALDDASLDETMRQLRGRSWSS